MLPYTVLLPLQVYEVLQYHKSPRYKDLLPVLGSQSMAMTLMLPFFFCPFHRCMK